jgi:DNA-binding LacI/PurR family transcriptional regulator
LVSTIKSVAKRAGVSTATVSRVINGHGRVRPATAERVRKSIIELNFRPNIIGRSLKTARTGTLGVMIPTLANPVFADAVAGIQDAARAAGYAIVITATDYCAGYESTSVHTMLSNRVEGLILTVTDAENNGLLDQLDAEGNRYVLLYNQPCSHPRSTVTVDNVAAGRLVAEHLVALGHRRIGMVTGHPTASDRADARRTGFIAGLDDAGLHDPPVVEVDFMDMERSDGLWRLLSAPSAPTALFCSNDALAIAVIGLLRGLGKNVPGDISIIGFDGISIGELIEPSLATIEQPSREMGNTAVRHLLDRLSGDASPQAIILPHRLRPGGTAGPVPHRDLAYLRKSPTDRNKDLKP